MENFRVQYRGEKYDLSEFLRHHPGGINYIEKYREEDVDNMMKGTKHSDAARYLLREYKIGGRDESDTTAEDLEKYIDWSKPIFSQVGKLGEKYNEWSISPVDRQLRLFQSDFLESLSVCPWYFVPIVWIPIVTYFIRDGYCKYIPESSGPINILPVILYVLFGIFLWTLLEYTLHKYVFHLTPSGSHEAVIKFHFLIHGLHHKSPFDARRLVFPPVPAMMIGYVIYKAGAMVLPENVLHLTMGGIFLGYILYDMTHYYIHNGTPCEGTFMYKMKRYHTYHHFSHHDSGYGVSSTTWDTIFGTFIHLKKLGMGIKWQ